jgi:hypothetical protein
MRGCYLMDNVRSLGFTLASNKLNFKAPVAVVHNRLSNVHGQCNESHPRHKFIVILIQPAP